MYSRLGYAALKIEATENTALLPSVFFGILKADIMTKWLYKGSSPVMFDRNMLVNAVNGPVDPPSGNITLQIEALKFPWLAKAVMGAMSSGVYFAISGVTGTFQVGETVTGGTSSATATVVAVSKEADYLLVTIASGTFTAAGETITGGTSSATATLGVNAATVYGHEAKAPQNSLPTFTLEIGYTDFAVRFTGARFNAFSSVADKDNMIEADLSVMARAAFIVGRVGAAVTSGSGSKTIPLDQTQGLVTSDSIKVFRPSTGAYLDFSASSVKTHTIGSISAGTSITVTNLQTSLAAGDLIVLAPQTTSYSQAKEMSWIGGSVARVGDTLTGPITATASLYSIEGFQLSILNEMEGRHAANAATIAGRFPAALHLKAFKAAGKLKRAFLDNIFIDRLRNGSQTALQVRHTGDQIASTGLYHTIDWRIAFGILQAFNPPLGTDEVVNEDVSFDAYKDTTSGYTAKILTVNSVASYT